MQNLSAIDEHGGRALFCIETSRIDFTDVCNQLGFDTPRLAQELGQAPEQLIIRECRDRFKFWFVFHDYNTSTGCFVVWDEL
jgi:hypothetical protein